MGQHAKRFDAVNAQKGTGLRAVADQLKTIADTIEEWYDPNDSHVIGAVQRFEMGLNQLTMAAPHPGEPAKAEKPRTGRRAKPKPDTPPPGEDVETTEDDG